MIGDYSVVSSTVVSSNPFVARLVGSLLTSFTPKNTSLAKVLGRMEVQKKKIEPFFPEPTKRRVLI